MLLCSAFNGLTQRAWTELQAAGHEVTVQVAGGDHALRAAVAAVQPDVVICPFLRDRVPEEVWTSYPTIVIHPGPRGDRGPSSLDWAIMDAEPGLGSHRAAGDRGDGGSDLGLAHLRRRHRPAPQERPLQRIDGPTPRWR
jgi:putative two-component system hydrogenase maturation factor HypX/HoxX